MIDLGPLGDRAWLARFATEEAAARWAEGVRRQAWPGVVDVVLAYQSAAVFADPDATDLDLLESRLRTLEPGPTGRPTGKLVELPVFYNGEDLAEVARRLKLTAEEVVTLHSGCVYQVFAIGFLPGFPYAGYLPEQLHGLPRRDVPRTSVPSGSVAIAGRQTAVYPSRSPGGWHLIGRTPLRIVDLAQAHFPIQAGDRLRFVPIDLEEYMARQGALL
jgi:KipI family sensor histidine kinase inhibitor